MLDMEFLLVIGVYALVGVPVMYLFWLGRQSSSAEAATTPALLTKEQPAAPAKKGQSQWFWFFVGLVIVNAYRGQQGLPPIGPFVHQPQKRTAPVPVTRHDDHQRSHAFTTALYWNSTMYKLARCDELENASTVEESIKQMHVWQNDLAAAKAVSTRGVDVELAAVAGRHVDEQLSMLAKLQEWLERLPAESRQMSFAEASGLGMQKPNHLILPLVEQIARQADEAIELRGRLKERYKGVSFPLPSDGGLNAKQPLR